MISGSYILIIPAIIAAATIVLASVPDIMQLMTRSIKTASLCIVLSLAVLYCIVINKGVTTGNFNDFSPAKISTVFESKEALEKRTRMAISRCRSFVIARIEETGQEGGVIKASAGQDSMWEFCAEQFGVNYWKYDTGINGRKGGEVLCEAYAGSGYVSAEVDGWCTTVFRRDAL